MMLARDLMTKEVVSVPPDMPVNEVAQLLLRKTISGAPVVDAKGAVIGMVSEGDLIGRNDKDREARRDWWLTLLAEGEDLNPDFLKSIRRQPKAREVMVSPVITVSETTDAAEIARILKEHRIKRVPVVRDGRIVGIVSRADLLDAVATRT
jgi:CBS domain-containing protein